MEVPFIPLHRTWTLFFHAKNRDKKYSSNQTKLIDISDIKTFWGTFNNIPKPTLMFSDGKTDKIIKRTGETPNALSFFSKGIEPCWEDVKNSTGAEWSIRKFKDVSDVDVIWINLLVDIVSENFDHSENINGVRIVDCTRETQIMYRIELWFDDTSLNSYFESKLKELTRLPNYTKLLYREHKSVKEY
jgi:hypothetical protein